MTYKNILLEEHDGILVLTINREKAYNALNQDTFAEIRHVFEKAYLEVENLKGVVITGAGKKAFVAGADIKELAGLTPFEGKKLSRNGQKIFFLIERFHRPVIAAVNGFALGGGCELAMACHMRIAGAKAKFGQPEVNLGIIPGYGGTQRLTQLIGKAKSMELHLTADMIDAEEAYRLGLANKVVPQGEELAGAKKIIEKTATKGPVAIANCIAAINSFYNKEVDGYQIEARQFKKCMHTEDFKEGTTAFMEKRAAEFKGK